MITQDDMLKLSDANRILIRGNGYIYLLPHQDLRNWISNYTVTFPSKSMISDNYTVIPHGSATLVFSFDGSALYCNLFGPATKPCSVGSQANQFTMMFIIEFQPAGLYTFTSVKQSELTDQRIPFELINPKLNRSIVETLYNAPNINELIAGIDRLMLSCLHTLCPSTLSLTTQMIIDNMGNISAKELSDNVYYSERHLSRIYDQYLGMSVKSFSRMVRINKAIRLLHNPSHSITSACYATGFYDLPHFIHDFVSACGITPQKYRSNMSDFYSQIAKF
jgi:AraC-like DNA-binding protein